VALIAGALGRLGHEVECIDVSGPVSRLADRLERDRPDLVFNTAEGSRGRFREAFFPALFEQLELPFSGSDAHVCALTLDKHRTKQVLVELGVPMPRWQFVTEVGCVVPGELQYPVIVKPNFEGSSIGVTADSVVDGPGALRTRVDALLRRFPDGVLIEEFIAGRDLVVPFLEAASPATGDVLEPATYAYEGASAERAYGIYDYDMKVSGFSGLRVQVPGDMPARTRDAVMCVSRDVFTSLGIRDVGRIDYRLAPDGRFYLLEVNALPSLEAGASLYLAGALVGLDRPEAVLGAVVDSATVRYGLVDASVGRRRRRPTLEMPSLA